MICGWYGDRTKVIIIKYDRRKFRSQTSDNMDRCKAEQGSPSEKVQNTWVSEHFWKLRCRKSARRCGAKHISKSKCTKHTMYGPLLEVEMSKKCTLLWREAHFQVKMYKAHHVRTTFVSWDVEKVHAVVARSTFPSQNLQNTPCTDHFCKLRCRKSARRCGAKHISKSKCTKHTMYGPLLAVEMSKSTRCCGTSTFPSQNVQSTPCTDHFWKLRCRKSARRCGAKHISKSKCTKHHAQTTFGGSDVVSRGRRKGLWTLSKVSKTWGFCSIFNYNHHYTTLHSNTFHNTTTTTTPSLHSTTLHSTTLHCCQLHSITIHYTTLHYTTLHHTKLHYTTLHYTTLHYTTLHYLPLHYITLHYTPLHVTTLHSTTLQLQLHNYTPLHSTTLKYTTLHYTTLRYIPLHSIHYTTLHYTTLHWMTLHHR